MRGDKPFVFTNLKALQGVTEIADFIIDMGGVQSSEKKAGGSD